MLSSTSIQTMIPAPPLHPKEPSQASFHPAPACPCPALSCCRTASRIVGASIPFPGSCWPIPTGQSSRRRCSGSATRCALLSCAQPLARSGHPTSRGHPTPSSHSAWPPRLQPPPPAVRSPSAPSREPPPLRRGKGALAATAAAGKRRALGAGCGECRAANQAKRPPGAVSAYHAPCFAGSSPLLSFRESLPACQRSRSKLCSAPQMASGWVERMFAPPEGMNTLRSVHSLRPGTTGALPGAQGLGATTRPGTAAAALGGPAVGASPGPGGASPQGSPQKNSNASPARPGPALSPTRGAPSSPSPNASPTRPATAATAFGSPSRPGTARNGGAGGGNPWAPAKQETGFEHRVPGQPPNHLTYQQRVWLMAPQEAFSKKNGGLLMDGCLMGACTGWMDRSTSCGARPPLTQSSSFATA